ncbi:MAG TPA: YdeI/OmpD-associated family protein [Ktedonobacterales bacterium]
MPASVRDALDQGGLMGAYLARPLYQQNDYLRWITSAWRPETREKRLAQMLDELPAGDAYMRMPYRAMHGQS